MTKRSQDNARPPRAFKLDQPKPAEKLKSKPKPKQKAPRKPQKIDLESDINILPDMAAEIRQSKIGEDDTNGLTPPPPETVQRRFSFSKLFFSAFLGLLSLGIGLYVDGLVRTLFERYTYLGWFGLGLTALLVFALLGIIIRELMALSRLNSIEHLRESIHEANCSQENKATQKAITELASLYKNRPDTARGRAIIQEQQGQIIDAQDYLNIAEKQLLAPLDERARKMVLDSAKRVSVVTAVSPRAVVDIAYVLMENFKLIRKLSEHYGGKPGVLGFWRLTHTILSHLAVTGTIAVGDSLLQQVIGHGLAARLSARLGEGVLNGLLTARLGIAAIDVCRPAPFIYEDRPSAGDFLADLMKLNPVKEKK